MYFGFKVLLSAVIIALISELSKRSVFLGALTASLPIVSLLSLTWIYYETHDTVKVASLSREILWLVVPSLVFFALFPWFIEQGRSFLFAMTTGVLATVIAYAGMIAIRKSFL